MSSTSGTSHFINFVQKATGSCSKPERGNTVEPTKLSSAAQQQNPRLQLQILYEDSTAEEPNHGVYETKAMKEVMDEVFSAIYKLKISYTQLQAAHIPYNVEKLQMADKGVIKEMKRLSELKHRYNENVARFGHGFDQDDEEEEESSKAAAESRDMEIKSLKSDLEKLKMANQELQRRLRRTIKKDSGTINGPVVKLLELNVHRARESAKSYTKCLLSLMKRAQWDLDAAVGSIEPGMNYTKPGHKKLAFESYVNMRMFQGFENENFYLTGTLSSIMDAEKHRKECLAQFESMQNVEPLRLVSVTPDCLFGKFCLKKFLQVVHPKMEESFFGNFEHRNQIVNGVHPRSQFYSIFLRFAKAVWLVHRLAFSLDPPASIFYVRRGVDFNGLYMETLVLGHSSNGDQNIQQQELSKSVGFTVMPGFRLGNKTLLKCQVYAQTSPVD